MKTLSHMDLESNEESKHGLPLYKRSFFHKEIVVGLKCGDESVLGYVYSKHIHDLYRFGSQITCFVTGNYIYTVFGK